MGGKQNINISFRLPVTTNTNDMKNILNKYNLLNCFKKLQKFVYTYFASCNLTNSIIEDIIINDDISVNKSPYRPSEWFTSCRYLKIATYDPLSTVITRRIITNIERIFFCNNSLWLQVMVPSPWMIWMWIEFRKAAKITAANWILFAVSRD